MCLIDKPAKDLLKQQCPKLWYSYIMRLIAVIGILFVLASCSDSDTPENFGLSCWIKNPSSNRVIYEFNFDTNLVTQKFTANNLANNEPLSIVEISPVTIIFEDSISLNIFDRSSLMIKKDYYARDKNAKPAMTVLLKCETTQF
jgi:hypothetical protein|tara:strand:+ start:572 stop:1003 length:432 start_codon:yes stop_codon:yes gene_type:complete